MPDNTLKVGVRNQGNALVQISKFSIYTLGSDCRITGEARWSSYVLAGQSQAWRRKTNSSEKIADGRLRLTADTDADTEFVLIRPAV